MESRSVVGSALLPSLRRLQGKHNFKVPEHSLKWAEAELRRKASGKRTRVQLDLLARKNTGVVTGECKSWGGFSKKATWNIVNEVFVEGKDSLFLYLTEIRGEPVVESCLVLWSRSDEHRRIEERMTRIYDRPIRLFYLDELLSNPSGRTTEAVDDRLRLLDESVGIVKSMLGKT